MESEKRQMKTKACWFLCATIILCLLGWTSRGQSMKPTRLSWEYKVVNTWQMSEADLNRLGAEGWEFVQFDTGVRTGNVSVTAHYLFKRAK
jgi:hypothetical protein